MVEGNRGFITLYLFKFKDDELKLLYFKALKYGVKFITMKKPTKKAANELQTVLIVACLIGMGGQRRQVITDFMMDSIYYSKRTDGYYAKLRAEKVIRRDNIDGISISKEIGYLLLLWKSKFRKIMKPKEGVVSLWSNLHGNPLEYNSVTKRVKKYVQGIWPEKKKVTPITFRSLMISISFQKGLTKPNQKIADFVNDLSIYLNTSGKIMEQHYNRFHNCERNTDTMNLMHSEILSNPEIQKFRDELNNKKKKIFRK